MDEIALGSPFDIVLVCVKSFDTAAAARDIRANARLLVTRAPIVLCQNGWGNREAFSAEYPEARLYQARIITGFIKSVENRVEITVHADAMHVGSLTGEPSSEIEWLCDSLSKGDLPTKPTDFIERDLWAKMLYNCALNPLSALFDVSYGVLAEYEETRAIMDSVHEEVFDVMRAIGYRTHWETLRAYSQAFYGQMVPSTAAHYASMLQDIRAGRRTEIDALNGAVVSEGLRCGVGVPANRMLYGMVRFREARSGNSSGPAL